ncbi:hypothetical protein CLU79DRAFT_835325 [Phycomyces nitens]|nr:hypothetical protein CLU79DRAFT_835325 [Phycomyces nitens]
MPAHQDSEPNNMAEFSSQDSEQLAKSAKAIENCRDLCAQFGFTVKQEASTHRNIYVYCSREGVPDSLRKRGSTPQRKRPSKRCDCRWRVVLYEKEGLWEFRKSQNPDAAKHNHELMRPDEIERNWPKAVIDMICELARQRLTTQEIRTAVKDRFTTISWNERRFYNRLSEERQKIKHREAAVRARHLTKVWTKVCMAAAGNEELSRFVEAEAKKILAAVCQSAQIEPDTLNPPSMEIAEDTVERLAAGNTTPVENDEPEGSNRGANRAENNSYGRHATNQQQSYNGFLEQLPLEIEENIRPQDNPPLNARNNRQGGTITTKPPEAPKGYTSVVVPQHTYFVKLHSQRSIGDLNIARNSRRAREDSTADDSGSEIAAPTRRPSKRGRDSAMDDQTPGHADALHALQQQQQQQHTFLAGTHQHRTHPMPITPVPQSLQQGPSPPPPQASFVYHSTYENQGIPLGTPLQNYVHPSFYHQTMPSQSSTNGFVPNSELNFQFNTSQGPMIRPHSQAGGSSSNENQESVLHSGLQANNMIHGKPPSPSPGPSVPSSNISNHHHNQHAIQTLTIIQHQPQPQ